MKKYLSVAFALCVILAIAVFPIVAGTSYDENPYAFDEYHYDVFEPSWIDDGRLINDAWTYVAGHFAEVYNRVYHRPVFGSAGAGSSARGTLVSHANFAGQWVAPNQTFPIGDGVRGGFYARPNGNANNMHNGFTFLEIDVAELAASPGGVNVTIATSNQSGGNLPNASWNTPIFNGAYSYNVRMVGSELIVTVNGFRAGSWGATVTNNLANWGNNPNSAIRHQRNASINLGNASGTVFVFFHAQNLDFYSNDYNTVIGCEYDHSVQSDRYISAGYVDHAVVIVNQYGHEIYHGSFGYKHLPLCDFIPEGHHYFTAILVVNGMQQGGYNIVIEVTRTGDGNRLAQVVYGNWIDFGRIEVNVANDLVICDWC